MNDDENDMYDPNRESISLKTKKNSKIFSSEKNAIPIVNISSSKIGTYVFS